MKLIYIPRLTLDGKHDPFTYHKSYYSKASNYALIKRQTYMPWCYDVNSMIIDHDHTSWREIWEFWMTKCSEKFWQASIIGMEYGSNMIATAKQAIGSKTQVTSTCSYNSWTFKQIAFDVWNSTICHFITSSSMLLRPSAPYVSFMLLKTQLMNRQRWYKYTIQSPIRQYLTDTINRLIQCHQVPDHHGYIPIKGHRLQIKT